MSIGDKAATVLFMLVAGSMAGFVGYHAFSLVWRDLANGAVTRSTWLLLAFGIFTLVAMTLGVRQCARSLRRKKPADTAR